MCPVQCTNKDHDDTAIAGAVPPSVKRMLRKEKKRQKVKKKYTRKIAGTVPPIVIDPWVPKKCLVIN